jgi:hypothetical protein
VDVSSILEYQPKRLVSFCASRNVKELFYLSGAKLMAVEVKTIWSGFEPGVPKLLFESVSAGLYDFAVSGDGQRFLIPVPVEEGSSAPITVVLNWTIDVKR